MLSQLKPEYRAAIFLVSVTGIYMLSVARLVVVHFGWDALDAFAVHEINAPLALAWALTFGLTLAGYGVHLGAHRRQGHLGEKLRADMRAFLRPETMSLRASILFAWFFLILSFSVFKSMIGRLTGFYFDPLIAGFEHRVLLGHDAWQVTHALFDSTLATLYLQTCYNVWFGFMWFGLIVCLTYAHTGYRTLRYMIAFLLHWIVIGSVFAYLLPSAGPCFYDLLFHGQRFGALMAHLHGADHHLIADGIGTGVSSLRIQDMLWALYRNNDGSFGAGISAMPSMHVALAVLMACAVRDVSRRWGYFMTVFAVSVWIASVHLGWHYASDGIVGAGLSILLWRASGFLTREILRTRAPAGDAQAAAPFPAVNKAGNAFPRPVRNPAAG